MFMVFHSQFEKHQEDIYLTFDDDDECEDDYFYGLYEIDNWVVVLSFEDMFCLYIIIQSISSTIAFGEVFLFYSQLLFY